MRLPLAAALLLSAALPAARAAPTPAAPPRAAPSIGAHGMAQAAHEQPGAPHLSRVILSTGGVGYFEYAAQADGPAHIVLNVPIAQIDDLLASLVVLDPAGGTASVELPGRDDTDQAFAATPIGPDALASPLAYLNALRGTEVTVQGPRPMTGRILRAETVPETTGTHSQPRTRVTLLGAQGLQQFVLEDAGSVQVADPALRAGIDRALRAVQAQAGQTTRAVTIRLGDGGKRTVAIGYVAGAPLWKATYRLILNHAQARLQAWATLENQSGADWNGVSLTLQYGNPVAFRQALYRSYFVQRPEVPVEVLGHVLPDIDTRARHADALTPPRSAMAPAPSAAGVMLAKAAAAPPPPAAVAETGEETIFTLPHPIDLPAGHTLDVPILDQTVAAPRIGLVPFHQTHPLTAVRLRNDTPNALPAGVVTVYDTSTAGPTFAGDARLGGLPAGQTRLLSYARDLRTDIDMRQTPQPETVTAITAANGVLTYTVRSRQAIRFVLTAPVTEARDLELEIPRGGLGQTLSVAEGDAGPIQQTDTAWRVPVSLTPHQTRALTVYLDQPLSRTVALTDGDTAVIASIAGQDRLPPAAQAAIRHILDLRQQAARKAADVAALQKQMDGVLTDQDRLRKNLAVVTPADALRVRLVQALDASETQAEQLRKAIAEAETTAAKAHQTLTEAVSSLHL